MDNNVMPSEIQHHLGLLISQGCLLYDNVHNVYFQPAVGVLTPSQLFWIDIILDDPQTVHSISYSKLEFRKQQYFMFKSENDDVVAYVFPNEVQFKQLVGNH